MLLYLNDKLISNKSERKIKEITLLPKVKDIVSSAIKSKTWQDWNEVFQKEIESSVKANKSKLANLEGKSAIRTNVGKIAKVRSLPSLQLTTS